MIVLASAMRQRVRGGAAGFHAASARSTNSTLLHWALLRASPRRVRMAAWNFPVIRCGMYERAQCGGNGHSLADISGKTLTEMRDQERPRCSLGKLRVSPKLPWQMHQRDVTVAMAGLHRAPTRFLRSASLRNDFQRRTPATRNAGYMFRMASA